MKAVQAVLKTEDAVQMSCAFCFYYLTHQMNSSLSLGLDADYNVAF